MLRRKLGSKKIRMVYADAPEPGRTLADYLVPLASDFPNIRAIALETARVTGCYDVARVDFRLDKHDHDKPYVIEINSLPGITPISDLTLMVQADGWTHADMINGVLDAQTLSVREGAEVLGMF